MEQILRDHKKESENKKDAENKKPTTQLTDGQACMYIEDTVKIQIILKGKLFNENYFGSFKPQGFKVLDLWGRAVIDYKTTQRIKLIIFNQEKQIL